MQILYSNKAEGKRQVGSNPYQENASKARPKEVTFLIVSLTSSQDFFFLFAFLKT